MKRLDFLRTLPGLVAIPAVCEAIGDTPQVLRPTPSPHGLSGMGGGVQKTVNGRWHPDDGSVFFSDRDGHCEYFQERKP